MGNSPLLHEALNAAIQAAPFDVNVLITGENGTGKEVFHKILHNYSRRSHKRCVAVNCGGLPEGTIDSELFGHVKGAYTGATTDRKGYFEEADGGTIFLDEVGELPMVTQAKLLRVLETGEYYHMGSSEMHRTDVRVVAATNVDLHEAIRQGKFREDLYYRLSTVRINVPPLRSREGDIYLLFRKFANDIAARYKMPAIRLDDMALHRLMAYNWPGNVRQLLHVVEEISIIETERLITLDILNRHLPEFSSGVSVGGGTQGNGSTSFGIGEKEMLYKVIFEMRQQLDEIRKHLGLGKSHSPHVTHALPPATVAPISTATVAPISPTVTDKIDLAEFQPAESIEVDDDFEEVKTKDTIEIEAIMAALKRNGGNKEKAAKELGMSSRTIHRKLKKLESTTTTSTTTD